jgi:hypothetical protein
MRSYDYCHFEVCLSAEASTVYGAEPAAATQPQLGLPDIDYLRKTAARLADKAVEQYKRAKRALETREGYDLKRARKDVAELLAAKPESEFSEQEWALVKTLRDMEHEARYDYDDEE